MTIQHDIASAESLFDSIIGGMFCYRLIRERDKKGRFTGCRYERVPPLPEQPEVRGQKGQTTVMEASATAEK